MKEASSGHHAAKRVMVIYGTRPEAIKVAPLILALRSHVDIEPVIAVTGQHREMLDQVNDLFQIEPTHDLNLMVQGAELADMASRALQATSRIIAEERPNAVVVQGDTSTAFIAALSAFYQQIPVVHLEAGLRTGNIQSPFPEEANRRLTAPISALHLAPTSTSCDNLVAEGIPVAAVAITGNTVIDALHATVEMPVRFEDKSLGALIANERPFVLVTVHRRESWGQPMREAMAGLRIVAERFPWFAFVLPMHKNPIVRDVVEPALAGLENVLLIEPLSYHEFAHAMRASYLLLTDSGGVQEEAPSLGKPVLVMRDTTERPEAVLAGTVKLVGTSASTVATELSRLIEDARAYKIMANAVNPYGDGRAAARSVAAIGELLGIGDRLPNFQPDQPGGVNV